MQERSATQRGVQLITLLKILVAGAIGLLLYFAHVAFIPVALALLILAARLTLLMLLTALVFTVTWVLVLARLVFVSIGVICAIAH